MKTIVSRFKNYVQNSKINFKKKFQESKEKPISKRKSFMIGFTTVVAIFGLTLFGSALSAFAKDIPKGNPPIGSVPAPTGVAPAPVLPPNKVIFNAGLAGAASTVCGLAVTSGSFVVGVICGLIVVIGILQVQGK